MALIAALATSLAFGLGAALPSKNNNNNLNARQEPSGIWQPAVNTSWNYQLSAPPPTSNPHGISIWDIDLFDSPASLISGLQSSGAKVICYFSAGSSENWRPDFSNFTSADQGASLDGWAGERWLDSNSANVRAIMAARLQLAAQKHCDGVDPDNVDAYNNGGGGLGLTQDDAVGYARFLAANAAARGLAVGLKNAGEIVPKVIDVVQWAVNEQCVQYQECGAYTPFVSAGKPVFNVEYPKGESTSDDKPIEPDKLKSICDQQADGSVGFSTIVKNIDLDGWIELCNGTAAVLD